MVFSSMVFLWIFFPIVFVASLIIRKPKYQNILLLIASLLFYAWGEPRYLILLLFSIIMNWAFGLLIDRFRAHGKLLLALDIAVNLGLMGYYKYANFAINTVNRLFHQDFPAANISLPIGISFFTFQAMSYVIDLYRGKYKVQKNLLNLMLYVSFFPQLIAGPIVMYRYIDAQIMGRTRTKEKITSGMRRFLYGLGKKVIIANLTAQVCDNLYNLGTGNLTGGMAWLFAIAYTLEIYYDFSGYSDMAIGLGRMFGFEFLENFTLPYLSKSIREFWRRWHISLGSWFRDYVYIPLGGNRKGKVRTYVNLAIVFALTGLWHGAAWTFVGWGLFHGFFIIMERMGFSKVLDRHPIFARVYTLLVVIVGWVFFRAASVHDGAAVLVRMAAPWRYTTTLYPLGTQVSILGMLAVAFGIVGCGPIQQIFSAGPLKKIGAGWKNSVWEALWLTVILVYSLLLLANNTYNPFIYFRF
jgi:alginate O-acetyltransferase complex protein AlgI